MAEPERLSAARLKVWRERQLEAQHGKCALCLLPCPSSKAVADHDHATGQLRAVLHSGCNSLLGKIENNYRRYGVASLSAFTQGVARYLDQHKTPRHGLLYPTHRTPDEKRVKRNAKARKARAMKKETS